ncbi:type VI secretion system tube protein Hcp, partial [Klebsiella variicola]|nr:type VI secretion system tube protein Hcp [Klebsiella variicola]
MPIPPYMWLKDDGGADTKGSVDVQEREGSIETRLSPSHPPSPPE